MFVWASRRSGRRALTSSSGMPTDAGPPFHSTRGATSRRFSCAGSPGTLDWKWMNSSGTNDPGCSKTTVSPGLSVCLDPPANRWLRAAWFCGLAPLATGIAIFVAWLFLCVPWLEMAGVLIIYVGILLIAIGAACLAVYLWLSRRSRSQPLRQLAVQAAKIVAVFVANFVVAGIMILIVLMLGDRYVLNMVNDSSDELAEVQITHSFGKTSHLDNIPPGRSSRRAFWIREGPVMLKYRRIAEAMTIDIDNVSGGGGRSTVIVRSAGRPEIRREGDRSGRHGSHHDWD